MNLDVVALWKSILFIVIEGLRHGIWPFNVSISTNKLCKRLSECLMQLMHPTNNKHFPRNHLLSRALLYLISSFLTIIRHFELVKPVATLE